MNYYNQIKQKLMDNELYSKIKDYSKERHKVITYFEIGKLLYQAGSEYKIKIGNTYNYIDLLLFNYKYNCFVVVELKVTELRKEHIGQIQVYMNYIDNKLRKIDQDKTIGIIICSITFIDIY